MADDGIIDDILNLLDTATPTRSLMAQLKRLRKPPRGLHLGVEGRARNPTLAGVSDAYVTRSVRGDAPGRPWRVTFLKPGEVPVLHTNHRSLDDAVKAVDVMFGGFHLVELIESMARWEAREVARMVLAERNAYVTLSPRWVRVLIERAPTRAVELVRKRRCFSDAEAQQAAKSIIRSIAALKQHVHLRGDRERAVKRLLQHALKARHPEQRIDAISRALELMAPFYKEGPGSRPPELLRRPDRDAKDPRLGHLFHGLPR